MIKSVHIREATPLDIPALLRLVKMLAIHEKKNPEDILLSENKMMAHGFGSKPYFNILVAEDNGLLVGYALYFFTYASSVGAPILYLEDLFVNENHRRIGVGNKFLSTLANYAIQHGCCRMEWHTFSWNHSAIDFYKTIGANLKPDLVQVRLEDEALWKC